MKIGIWSYPSLFQSSGGLQNQIAETVAALSSQGCDVKYLNLREEDLAQFDVVHVFSAAHGNHTIARMLANRNVPFVLSPVLQAYWNKKFSMLVGGLSWLTGFLSRWRMRTEYDHYRACMMLADCVIGLGKREQDALINCFDIPQKKCRVIPNGIAQRFFNADSRSFVDAYGISPGFVLCVGLIGEWKNQAMVVKAAERCGLHTVIIGHCKKEDEAYLDMLKASPNVTYIGPLPYESELLPSAYAAAGVFCLPSVSEVMPLTALEALAAGTPVVVTKNNSMDLNCDGLYFVDPGSLSEVSDAINHALSQRMPRDEISHWVSHLSWDKVAHELIDIYRMVKRSK